MRRRNSLIGALFSRVGLLFVVMIAIASIVTYRIARDSIDDAYDAQLIVAANVLHALMGDELGEARTNHHPTELSVDDAPLLSAEDRKSFNTFADWRMFRIWQNGRLVMRSDTGPPGTHPEPAEEGFKDFVYQNSKWRVYALKLPEQPITVEVGERLEIRTELVRSISFNLALPLLLIVPATALLIWLALNNGLAALRELIAELGNRSVRDLTPFSPASWPSDLKPLLGSINQFLARLDRTLQRERRFIDQAAHQLRTPLSVIKLQAQMISDATTSADRSEMAGQLAAGVDRASGLVDRLLTLARLESISEAGGPADLAAETSAVIADLAPLATARDVSLAYDGPAAALVAADAALVRIICANLIDNAIRYSPTGGEVQVEIFPGGESFEFSVTDAGPGIAPAERAAVLERFNRGSARQGEGVGLGLSIVSEALRLLNGQLILQDRPDGRSGLRACVVLPRQAAAIA